MSRVSSFLFLFVGACVYRFEFSEPSVCQPLVVGEEAALTFCVDADPDATNDVPRAAIEQVLASDGTTMRSRVTIEARTEGDGCGDASSVARVFFTPSIEGDYRVILKSQGPRPADYGVSRFTVSTEACR